MGFDTNSWLNSSGSSGGGGFFNSGFSGGGGGFNSGTNMSKYWDSSSDPTPGSNSTSTDWSKIPKGDDPYGFNKTLNQDKGKGFLKNFMQNMSSQGQGMSNQGSTSDGISSSGGSGKTASLGDGIYAVYPEITQPQQGSGIGGKIGALAGAAFMAPCTGGMSLGAAMGAIGGASALGGTAGSLFG